MEALRIMARRVPGQRRAGAPSGGLRKEGGSMGRLNILVAVALLALLGIASAQAPVGPILALLCTIGLGLGVVGAVHHAEVIAHRVGEPLGTLVLALAVTVIEASLILSMMVAGGEEMAVLPRDTIYAAVMIICNGVIGICLLLGGLAHREQSFRVEGAGAGMAALVVMASLTLVMPTVTTSAEGGRYTIGQMWFVAIASALLWAIFVFIQTVRHGDYFRPAVDEGSHEEEAAPPTTAQTWASFGLLLVSLVSVVGLAKLLSPSIERAVVGRGRAADRGRHRDRAAGAAARDRGGGARRARQPPADQPEPGHRLRARQHRAHGPGGRARRDGFPPAADPRPRGEGPRPAGHHVRGERDHAGQRADAHDAGRGAAGGVRGVPVHGGGALTTGPPQSAVVLHRRSTCNAGI
jgi:hypothetical protein